MRNIKILLADDHAIVMEGLKEVLSADEEISVVGCVQNGEEVLRFIKNNEVDIVILDINMPVMDGITCARHLKKEFPKVKIIILTMYAQRSFVEEIVKIGIDGCLLKNNTGKELIDAVLRVMGGRQYYDRIGTFNSQEEEVTQYKLSEREIDVIRLMSQGLTSIEIAEKLFISDHTVKTHRKNILKKLNVSNSSQAVQYCLSNQLI
ncbi:response regulator transcription factor [Marinoscillum sp. 108]|jgi:DNA-binding NarL/FixJ family response regulator|uniref:Response regulator n=1 Tax=Marinoscillum luteum TaxID=861051 RepID=A0ABW7NBT5_9BACT|nr:response regulator transcription factor [Marinoscillum sp. 108]VXD19710.1 LuxR family two component transcriptional regulator [Marinoscillum sp. 108]